MKNILFYVFVFFALNEICAQIDTLTPMGSSYMFVGIDDSNWKKVNVELIKISKTANSEKIETIELSGRFTEIPNGIYEFRKCREIIINSVNSIKISVKFNLLNHLESIRITSIVMSVDTGLNLPELKCIVLGKYKSNVFPKAFLRSIKLSEFNIQGGNFKSIPKEIMQLEKLKTLILSSNKIEYIPKEFYMLKEIEILNLQDNLLSSISMEVCQFKKLRQLYLLENKKLKIPTTTADCIKKLPHFENLFL